MRDRGVRDAHRASHLPSCPSSDQRSEQNIVAPKVNTVLSKGVHMTSLMQTSRLVISLLLALAFFSTAYIVRAQTPPPGFTALFNGTDLDGWRGGDTFDHRKYLA